VAAKQKFVSDGGVRLMLDKTFQVRRADLKNSIHAKYSEELSDAGIVGRFVIRYRIHREFSREWKKIAPSIHALY
jgi:hypothetical protein